jgi:hypothetical protein
MASGTGGCQSIRMDGRCRIALGKNMMPRMAVVAFGTLVAGTVGSMLVFLLVAGIAIHGA